MALVLIAFLLSFVSRNDCRSMSNFLLPLSMARKINVVEVADVKTPASTSDG